MNFTRTLAAAGTLIIAATPAFAATFNSGVVHSNAQAAFGTANAVQGKNVVTNASSTANNLVSELDAPKSSSHDEITITGAPGVHKSTVNVTSDASATWSSANAGVFTSTTTRTFVGGGRNQQGFFARIDTSDQQVSQAPAFDYKFTATGNDNLLSLDWTLTFTGTGSTLGLGAFDIDVRELIPGQPDVAFDMIRSGTSGHFQAALQAGHDYEFRILNQEGEQFSDRNFDQLFDNGDIGQFIWSIGNDGTGGGDGGDGGNGGGAGAVPEPASWALMLGGFGLVGGAMRASRRKTAVAFN